MDFRNSDTITGPRSEDILPTTATAAVKVVIVGGFGVGKTTMVGSVSEIRPLTTEETMTQAGVGVDDNYGVESKTATTVAMDFGRISISEELILYLFGTPGQERFWFLWNGLFEERWAPSSSSTPAGWRSASTSSGGWRNAAYRSSSPSTPSPTRRNTPSRPCAARWTCRTRSR